MLGRNNANMRILVGPERLFLNGKRPGIYTASPRPLLFPVLFIYATK